MSLEELAAACGLDAEVLRELQEFGLLQPDDRRRHRVLRRRGPGRGHGGRQFARFGVEPRHLRLYKNAADREAGFVEQIVLPLVRQRNPEARARAHETVDELTQLGQQLRGSLLRTPCGTSSTADRPTVPGTGADRVGRRGAAAVSVHPPDRTSARAE